MRDGGMYVNTARCVEKEPVAKHHIPIPSAHESNKHRMWQRRTVEATHKLYSRGQHCIDQPERSKGRKRCRGREQRDARELRDEGAYVNTARYVTGEEPVAKHPIPMPSARESNKH